MCKGRTSIDTIVRRSLDVPRADAKPDARRASHACRALSLLPSARALVSSLGDSRNWTWDRHMRMCVAGPQHCVNGVSCSCVSQFCSMTVWIVVWWYAVLYPSGSGGLAGFRHMQLQVKGHDAGLVVEP